MLESLVLYLWFFEQSPSVEGWCLLGVVAVAALHSAFWVYADLLVLKDRRRADFSSLFWALAVLTFWIVAFPTYLSQRPRLADVARESTEAAAPGGRGRKEARSPWPYGFIYLAAVLAVLALAYVTVNNYGSFKGGLGDRMDLLFGASSIALITISILIGFLGIFGWQSLRERVDELAEERFEESRRDWDLALDGRINSLNSLFYWRLAVAKSEGQENERLVEEERYQVPYLLDVAIHHGEKSVAALQEAGSDRVWPAKNNLGYMKALRGRSDDGRALLSTADELWKHYQESKTLGYLLTYIKIHLAYAQRTDLVSTSRIDEIRPILGELRDGAIGGLEDAQKRLVEEYHRELELLRGCDPNGLGAPAASKDVAVADGGEAVPRPKKQKRSPFWLRWFGRR